MRILLMLPLIFNASFVFSENPAAPDFFSNPGVFSGPNGSGTGNGGSGSSPTKDQYRKVQENFVKAMAPGNSGSFVSNYGQPRAFRDIELYDSGNSGGNGGGNSNEDESKKTRREETKDNIKFLTTRRSIEGLANNYKDMSKMANKEFFKQGLIRLAANPAGATTLMQGLTVLNEMNQNNLASIQMARTMLLSVDPSGYKLRELEACIADRPADGSMVGMICLNDVLQQGQTGPASGQQVNLDDPEKYFKPTDYIKNIGSTPEGAGGNAEQKITFAEIAIPKVIRDANQKAKEAYDELINYYGNFEYEKKVSQDAAQTNKFETKRTFKAPSSLIKKRFVDTWKEKWEALTTFLSDLCKEGNPSSSSASASAIAGAEASDFAIKDPLGPKTILQNQTRIKQLGTIDLPGKVTTSLFLRGLLREIVGEQPSQQACDAIKTIPLPPYISSSGSSSTSGGQNDENKKGTPPRMLMEAFTNASVISELLILYTNVYHKVQNFNTEMYYRNEMDELFQYATNYESLEAMHSDVGEEINDQLKRLEEFGKHLQADSAGLHNVPEMGAQ